MKCIIALGLFDGVHSGHCALLQKANEIGKECGYPVYALTFSGLEKFKNVKLINTVDNRIHLIGTLCNIHHVICLEFNNELQEMSGRDFLMKLARKYNVAHIVVGENFVFGSDRMNIANLKKSAQNLGIDVTVVPLTYINGCAVSSSRIRDALQSGDIENANQLMGHPYALSGYVQHGRHIGHTLGFPTLNVLIPHETICLPSGVYISKTHLPDGRYCNSLTNIGIHPTFECANEPLSETYLFSDVEEMYGKYISVDFLFFLRPEIKFESSEVLIAQLRKDKKLCKQYFLRKENSLG